MTVLVLTMHAAADGDALMLGWGDIAVTHRLLVDMGRTKTYRMLAPQLSKLGEVELFVMTHIDADHIEGAVPLMKANPLPFTAKRVWFNARVQLEAAKKRLAAPDRVALGAAQAEKITQGIVSSHWPWNIPFETIVSADSAEANAPIALAGGLSLTVLSPTDAKLAALLPSWDKELERAHLRTTDPDDVEEALAEGRVRMGGLNVDVLAAAPFKEDATAPNGAGIAFVAEHTGKRVLMSADAHPSVIEAALRRLGASENNRYRLDCLKVAHHGSKANTSPSLLGILDCTRFAFSTDGSRHGHPDAETIARILKADPKRAKTLIFNARQPATEQWDDAYLKTKWNYACQFPEPGAQGIAVEV